MKPLSLISGIIFSLFLISCSATKKAATSYDPSGVWDILVKDTPMGDVPAQVVLTKEGNVFKGTLKVTGEETTLQGLNIMENNMKCSFSTMDYYGSMAGVFSGETISGAVEVEGTSFEFTGKRLSK